MWSSGVILPGVRSVRYLAVRSCSLQAVRVHDGLSLAQFLMRVVSRISVIGCRARDHVDHDQLDAGKLWRDAGSGGGFVLGLVTQPGTEHTVDLVSEVGDVPQSARRLREPGRQRVLTDDEDSTDDQEASTNECHRHQDTIADRRGPQEVRADHLRLASGDRHRTGARHVDNDDDGWPPHIIRRRPTCRLPASQQCLQFHDSVS